VGRVFTGLRQQAVSVVTRAAAVAGIPVRKRTSDRVVLEETILPYFAAKADVSDILFVGCDWYTAHYSKLFRGKNYWTIEPDPAKSVFGAKQHVVDSLENLGRYFTSGQFDLILCNGVYGFGLDSEVQCETAFNNCYVCLRNLGELVLGWNDTPDRTPVPLNQLQSLSKFHPSHFPPLATWRYRTDTPHRHVYDFYVKPTGAA
jgi:hypothetical protein